MDYGGSANFRNKAKVSASDRVDAWCASTRDFVTLRLARSERWSKFK